MSSGNKLSLFWHSYKYRFVPWLALNFRNRTARRVDGGRKDKVVPDEEALRQVTALTRALVGALSRPLVAPQEQPFFQGSALNTSLDLMRHHPPPGGGTERQQYSRAARRIVLREKVDDVAEKLKVNEDFRAKVVCEEKASQEALKYGQSVNRFNPSSARDTKAPQKENLSQETMKYCEEINGSKSSRIEDIDIEQHPTEAYYNKTTRDKSDWRERPSPASTKLPLAVHIREGDTAVSCPEVEEAPNVRQFNDSLFPERIRLDHTTNQVGAPLKPLPVSVPSPLSKDVDPFDLCLVPPKASPSIHENAQQVLLATHGFRVECCPSTVGGIGVRLTDVIGREALPPGIVVGIYPGTLYLPQQQAVMLQSLGNSFLFRCFDGLLLDGGNRGLSKIIFRSCAGRDRVGPCPTADDSWLTVYPSNPLSVGQLVNNRSKSNPANVAYQEITIQPGTFTLPELAYLPTLWYSPPPHTPLLDVPIRLVVLVTIREVAAGEELFSEYFTIITDSPNRPVT